MPISNARTVCSCSIVLAFLYYAHPCASINWRYSQNSANILTTNATTESLRIFALKSFATAPFYKCAITRRWSMSRHAEMIRLILSLQFSTSHMMLKLYAHLVIRGVFGMICMIEWLCICPCSLLA